MPEEPAPSADAGALAAERLGIEFGDADELASRAGKALAALGADQPGLWKALRGVGIFRARGPAGRVAFLYSGQGSQYVNMLRALREAEPSVRETFAEADAVMQPILDRRLSDCVFPDPGDAAAVARAEQALLDTGVLQPAILAVDLALTRLLAERGYRPDLVMGHSLGEYAALVAAGVLPFAQALEAVSARGREMAHVRVKDAGRMAAVLAPLDEIEQVLATVDGYVVVANYNSRSQSVIGGETAAVERAAATFQAIGRTVVWLSVSHAFHTAIVSPASQALRDVLERLDVRPPRIPVVANLTGGLYPSGSDARAAVLDLLSRQMAAPVQFAKGLQTLFEAGVRVFVEVGPKRALQGFAEEAFSSDPSVFSLFTNHPKLPDAVALSQAVCGLRTALGDATRPGPSRSGRTAVRRDVVPVVRPPLALCKPTGITLERGRRVVVMADDGGVGLALVHQLEERGVKVLLVERQPPADELSGWLRAWLDEGPIHGLFWLAALDPEGDPADAEAFREARRSRLDLLDAAVRILLGTAGGRSAFLVAATRTGRVAPGPARPLGATVAGYAKALRRERPFALAKAVDLPALRPADAAALLVQETLADPGAVDVACTGGLRLTLAPSVAVDAEGRVGARCRRGVRRLRRNPARRPRPGARAFRRLPRGDVPPDRGDGRSRRRADRKASPRRSRRSRARAGALSPTARTCGIPRRPTPSAGRSRREALTWTCSCTPTRPRSTAGSPRSRRWLSPSCSTRGSPAGVNLTPGARGRSRRRERRPAVDVRAVRPGRARGRGRGRGTPRCDRRHHRLRAGRARARHRVGPLPGGGRPRRGHGPRPEPRRRGARHRAGVDGPPGVGRDGRRRRRRPRRPRPAHRRGARLHAVRRPSRRDGARRRTRTGAGRPAAWRRRASRGDRTRGARAGRRPRSPLDGTSRPSSRPSSGSRWCSARASGSSSRCARCCASTAATSWPNAG